MMYSWNIIYLLGPASSSHIKKKINIQDCHWTNFPLFSVSSRYWLPPSSPHARLRSNASSRIQLAPPSHSVQVSPHLTSPPFLISIHAGSSSSTGEQTHTFWTHSRLAEPQWESEGHLKSSGVVSHEMVLSSTQRSVTMAWLYSGALILHQQQVSRCWQSALLQVPDCYLCLSTRPCFEL